uniref:Uncharacterized protein n=1 Tax=Panagrolaimus superbus TaxID=310955 RepID=A0A914YFF6_9BILA
MGLSAGDQKKLSYLGIDSFSDLINKYQQLQVQVSGCTERSTASKLPRINSLKSIGSTVDLFKKCQNQHLQSRQMKEAQPEVKQSGPFTSSINTKVGKSGDGEASHIPLPMPDKFWG